MLEVKCSEGKIKQSKDDRGDTVLQMIRKVSEISIDPDLKDARREPCVYQREEAGDRGAGECQGR